jgi:hypothetical protein
VPANAPDDGQHSQIGGNSRDPPTGIRVWREKIARKLRRSKKSKSKEQNGFTQNTRLLQLEAEISNLKDNQRKRKYKK